MSASDKAVTKSHWPLEQTPFHSPVSHLTVSARGTRMYRAGCWGHRRDRALLVPILPELTLHLCSRSQPQPSMAPQEPVSSLKAPKRFHLPGRPQPSHPHLEPHSGSDLLPPESPWRPQPEATSAVPGLLCQPPPSGLCTCTGPPSVHQAEGHHCRDQSSPPGGQNGGVRTQGRVGPRSPELGEGPTLRKGGQSSSAAWARLSACSQSVWKRPAVLSL